MSSIHDDDKQTKKTPRPQDVKNLPAGALIQRTAKGDLLVFYSYARLPSGQRPRKYIGKVFNMVFYPDPEFQAFPERFPRPVKGKPGRKQDCAPTSAVPPIQKNTALKLQAKKFEG